METHSRRRRSPLRILAPLGLIVFGIALVLLISSAGNSGGAGRSSNAAQKQRDLGSTTKTTHRRRNASKPSDNLPQSPYIVKSGDTLGGIATTTGIPVVRLQELNPGLDQFSLVAGQRIKLR